MTSRFVGEDYGPEANPVRVVSGVNVGSWRRVSRDKHLEERLNASDVVSEWGFGLVMAAEWSRCRTWGEVGAVP